MSLINKIYDSSKDLFEPLGFEFDDLNRTWKNGIYYVCITIKSTKSFVHQGHYTLYKKDLETGTREMIFDEIDTYITIKTYLRKEKIQKILKEDE